jgi:membrane protease YdiL (CAAX protease family)
VTAEGTDAVRTDPREPEALGAYGPAALGRAGPSGADDAPRWTLREAGIALAATLVGQAMAVLGTALTLRADGLPDRLAFFGVVLLAYVLPAVTLFVLARQKRGSAWRALGFRPVKLGFVLGGVAVAFFVYLAASAAYVIAVIALGDAGLDVSGLSEERVGLTRMIEYFSEGGAIPLLLTAFVLVVVAPVVEESVFRGVVQPALAIRFGAAAGVVVSGLLFAAIHFDGWGFVQLAVLGVLLGALALLGRSIWPSIALHALVNTQALLLVFALGSLDELSGPLG